MTKLTDFPIEIFDEVLDKLEPVHRLTLRNVSRSFRTAVDNHGIGCKKVKISFGPGYIVELRIDGCKLVPFNHLDGIFKHELDEIGMNFWGADEQKRRDLLKCLVSTLETLENMCSTRILAFHGLKSQEILLLLPLFSVQDSLFIHRIAGVDKLKELVRLSQWNLLESAHWSDQIISVTLLKQFFHMCVFHIAVDGFSVENAIEIRDGLLNNEYFLYCYIRSANVWMNTSELAKVFQPGYTDGDSVQYDNTFTIGFNPVVIWIMRN